MKPLPGQLKISSGYEVKLSCDAVLPSLLTVLDHEGDLPVQPIEVSGQKNI
jgi:hypothetical protein